MQRTGYHHGWRGYSDSWHNFPIKFHNFQFRHSLVIKYFLLGNNKNISNVFTCYSSFCAPKHIFTNTNKYDTKQIKLDDEQCCLFPLCWLTEVYLHFTGACRLHKDDETRTHGTITQKTIIFILTVFKT